MDKNEAFAIVQCAALHDKRVCLSCGKQCNIIKALKIIRKEINYEKTRKN